MVAIIWTFKIIEPDDQVTNQPINQPISQPTNLPSNQRNQPANITTNQSNPATHHFKQLPCLLREQVE